MREIYNKSKEWEKQNLAFARPSSAGQEIPARDLEQGTLGEYDLRLVSACLTTEYAGHYWTLGHHELVI